MSDGSYDVVVVGGGPVGLYAGFRSALLLLRTRVVDKGRRWSRGFNVPMYHNLPTHPEGMTGKDLISQLRKGLVLHKDYVGIDDFVTIEAITRRDELFMLRGIHHPTKNERTYTSRVVVLATGVVDRRGRLATERMGLGLQGAARRPERAASGRKPQSFQCTMTGVSEGADAGRLAVYAGPRR